MLYIFISLALLLLYIYIIYPLLLFFLKYFRKNTQYSDSNLDMHKISILIPVFNEEKNIRNKIKNILSQSYPKSNLEIIIASDGSYDKTVPIAKKYKSEKLKIFDSKVRKGKNSVLNDAERLASGDILIFTDANAIFEENSIERLVIPFKDKSIGLVCGHLRYIKNSMGNVARGEGLYFRYEAIIKQLESDLGILPVVTGSIYAIRRELFVELEDEVANDFAHPVKIGAKGYKIVFQPEAIAYEKATQSMREEFWRRARIVTRGFTAFFRYFLKYKIYKGLRGLAYFSHKLLRWFVPIYLVILFISNLFLFDMTFFKITFIVQIMFYFLAILGMFLKARFISVPFYFCLINLAALIGFIHYILGRRKTIWEVARTTR